MVAYGEHGYRLFSPLFRDFLATRLSAATNGDRPRAVVSSPLVEDDPIYERLTKTEAALLRYFRANSETIVTPEQLLNDVWNRPNATTRRVQEAIRRLRLRLEQTTPPVGVIENERGRGYRFVPAPEG
jgi:DNA-binding response OmpR family regulator